MATPTILIVCPECGKQIKAPENVFGKKVRCKFCQAAFVAGKGGGQAPAPPSKPAKPAAGKSSKAQSAKPTTVEPAKPDEDDEEGANPYTLVDVNLSPRCPDCANEIEEGQVVCLHCGYHMQTRQKARLRKVYYLTFGQHFLWLLPGIACALAILSIIGFNVWYLIKISDLVNWETDSFFKGVWGVGAIKLWVVIISLFIIWFTGKFAVRRLILHPKPPEVEKLK